MLRVVLSVMLGFFLGYCGGGGVDLVVPGTERVVSTGRRAIPCLAPLPTATLLPKPENSSRTPNMGK